MMLVKIVVFISFVGLIKSILVVKDEENKIRLDVISATMIEIIENFSPHLNRTTVLAYGHPPDEFMSFLMDRETVLVVMNDLKKNPNDFMIPPPINSVENYIQYRVGFIIFFVETEAVISEGLAEITQSIFFASDAKMIVYSKENVDKAKFFYLCWWYQILYALLLDFNESKQVIAHEYTPYVVVKQNNSDNQFHCFATMQVQDMFEGNMGEYINCSSTCTDVTTDEEMESKNVLTCIEIHARVYSSDADLFIDKTLNLNGFEFIIFAVNVPSILSIDDNAKGMKKFLEKDGYILNILANKMNFGGRLISDQDKESRDNPKFATFLGGLMDIANRKKDIFASGIYLLPLSYPSIDLTYPIEGSGLCFIVHIAGAVPNWTNMINIFEPMAISLLIGAFHVMVLIYIITMKTNNTGFFEAIILGYIYTLQLFLSLPVNWVGKKDSLRSIVFLLFWLIFLVNYIFQGSIVSILTVPKYKKNINTFQELYDTGMLIEGYPSPDVQLPPTSDLFKGLNKRFKSNVELYSCVHALRYTDEKACWFDCLIAKRVYNYMRDDKGMPLLHIGRDKIHSHSLAYPMQKNSPLKRRFDYYLSNIMESGLMKKWRDSMAIIPVEIVINIKVLQMSDFMPYFVLLGAGLGSAMIVFITELTLFRLTVCFRNILSMIRNKRIGHPGMTSNKK